MVNGAEGIDAQTFAAAGVKITHRNPVAAGGPATPKWSADGAVGNGARAGSGCHPSLLFPELVPVPETVAA